MATGDLSETDADFDWGVTEYYKEEDKHPKSSKEAFKVLELKNIII